MKDCETILKFGRAREIAAYSHKLNRIRINLKYVESVEHLYEVIEHEVLHKTLADLYLPIGKEHNLIHSLQWATYMIPDCWQEHA